MIPALAVRSLARSPRRLVIGLLGVAVPVALFAATGFFVDTSAQRMSSQALAPVQIDMQALLRSPATPTAAIADRLAKQAGVTRVEPFTSVDLPATLPGSAAPRTVRVFAVRPDYLQNHSWVRPVNGSLTQGALLTQSLLPPGAATGGTVSLQVPGSPTPVALPVGGTVDLRRADAWYALLAGDNQGNVAYVPDAMVVDAGVFAARVLPALQAQALAQAQAQAQPPAGGTAATTTGAGPPTPGALSVQLHVSFDRGIFVADPNIAFNRSTGLRRTLERSSPGQITVLDNLGDSLGAARKDATNAKVLFLFLGVPGVLVAGALAVATAGSLASAQRRELGLLRLRGATDRQISRLTATLAGLIGLGGSVLGLGIGALGVTVLLGTGAWRGVSSTSILSSAVLASVVGLTVTALSLRTSSRAARGSSIVSQRRQLDPGGQPLWRRRRLDLLAIGLGVAVLVINAASGGFRTTPSESQTLSLSFYLLLAPVLLWVGVALLGLRGVSAALGRWTSPSRSRPLTSWVGAALRWLGRRPGRSIATAAIGILAVAFGTNLLAFVNTYDGAKRTEAALTVGADLRITPPATVPAPQPPLSDPGIAASTPVRALTLRVGADSRSAYAIDPASFAATVPVGPIDAAGRTVDRSVLATPAAALISTSFARDFNVVVGDPLSVGIRDTAGKTRSVVLTTVGEYTSVAPAAPGADIVTSTSIFGLPTDPTSVPAVAVPGSPPAGPGAVPQPDFYLARLAPGADVSKTAAVLRAAGPAPGTFTVLTYGDAVAKEQSTLATLNLAGLGTIETAGTIIIATLGLALLGAFLVLERRREYAVMRSLGATTRQVLVPPALEGSATLLISLLLGIPIGIGMTTITTRVLTPLFSISPALVQVPVGRVALLALGVAAAGGLALLTSLALVARLRTVAVLRES